MSWRHISPPQVRRGRDSDLRRKEHGLLEAEFAARVEATA
jgi:hypothetical protein